MRSKQPAYAAAYWKEYRKTAKPYVAKPCALCGKLFTRSPDERGNAKTCAKCRLSKCEQCGKRFSRARLTARFCAMSCKDKSQEGREPAALAANRGRRPRTYAKTRGLHGSAEDREWRIAVFERDKYTCVACGIVGGRLQADHIKPYADHPELRHVLSNGRTLCVPCHRATPTYGWGVYWQRKRKRKPLKERDREMERLAGWAVGGVEMRTEEQMETGQVMKTIDIETTYREGTFNSSKPGAVFYLFLHGLKHSAELRQAPPRIKTLEKGKLGKLVQCELLDPWPDAPGSIPVPVHDATNRWPEAK